MMPISTKLTAFVVITGLSVLLEGRAATISVTQNGSSLGIINSYAGDETGVDNYAGIASGANAPSYGPAAQGGELRMFFYEGTDGLHFTAFVNIWDDPSGVNGSVSLGIQVANSLPLPTVQVEDDPGEIFDNGGGSFSVNWAFASIRPDGTVIGALSGEDWTLTITPSSYTGINNIQVFGLSGDPITLEQNTSTIVFSAVPEPTHTLLTLFGALLLLARRTRN